MEKTLVIEFRDNISIPPSTDNESMVSFGEVECLPIDVPRKNSMGLKKFKSATKMEDKPK